MGLGEAWCGIGEKGKTRQVFPERDTFHSFDWKQVGHIHLRPCVRVSLTYLFYSTKRWFFEKVQKPMSFDTFLRGRAWPETVNFAYT